MPLRIAVGLVLLGVGGGCSRSDDEGEMGTDCGALVAAARRAQACDPALGPLAEVIAKEPDEERCRVAVRALLSAPAPSEGSVRSVHRNTPTPSTRPLSEDELQRLRTMPRPSTVTIRPDVSPQEPGILPTRAAIDGLDIDADPEGVLVTTVAPGPRTLEIEHAGETTHYCVDLRPCETLEVTAHGSKLARHPDVRPGPC